MGIYLQRRKDGSTYGTLVIDRVIDGARLKLTTGTKDLRKALTETSRKLRLDNVRIYTFRKCYANWLVESGIPQWRVEMYMGHLAQTQTQKYQTTEVFRWLAEDAEKMRSWLATQRPTRESHLNSADPTTTPA